MSLKSVKVGIINNPMPGDTGVKKKSKERNK